MKEKISDEKSLSKILLIIILVGSILAAVKNIFVGLQMDEEYAYTLSYRLIHGDRLLAQVWDPHQTSAFLLSFIEWVWIRFTGGEDYLFIWCRCVTTLIHLGICIYLYKSLRIYINRFYSCLIATTIFGIIPKDYIIPEFSLMMSWFLLLVILCLIRLDHFKTQKGNLRIIILSLLLGLSCFALALSYPSCIIIGPAVLICLIVKYRKSIWWIPVLVAVTIMLLGIIYLVYLLSYMTPDILIQNLKDAVVSCGSHDQGIAGHFEVILTDVLVFLAITVAVGIVSATLAAGIAALSRKGNSDDGEKIPFEIITISVMVIVSMVIQLMIIGFKLVRQLYGYDNYFYFLIIILSVIVSVRYRKVIDNKKFTFYLLLSGLGLIAIMMLTNMNSFRSVKYMTGAVAIGLLMIVRVLENTDNVRLKKLLHTVVVTCAFCIVMYRGIFYIGNDGSNRNITDIGYIIKNSAAKGVVTEYMAGYIYDSAYENWDRLIRDGDTVLLWDMSTSPYFNKNVSIGSYTTICTPTYYMDSLNRYWHNNPDKYPDVIIVSGWFGDINVSDEDGFLEWIENDFGASDVYIEDYFRYYIRRHGDM